jgi:hypothetical protein
VIFDIMKDPNRFKSGLHRRDLIKGAAAAGLGLAAGGLGSPGVFAQASVSKKFDSNGDGKLRLDELKT